MSKKTKFILVVICIIGYICYLAYQDEQKQIDKLLYQNKKQSEEAIEKSKEFLKRYENKPSIPTLLPAPNQIYFDPYQYPQISDMSQDILDKEPCKHCKSGWDPYITKNTVTYGIPQNKVWCEICNAWAFPHTHELCRACGGTGYVYK